MNIKPSFYNDFRCKADMCVDSCCIGWEIDIDSASLEKYNSVSGRFGEKLRSSIGTDGECSYFKLADNERCPFLCKDGLCDIYINLGEDALCDICREHPRFYNVTEDVTESGLGLCCEKVCEMLFDDNYTLEFLADGEVCQSEIHSAVLEIINAPDNDIIEKMDKLLTLFDCDNKITLNKSLGEKLVGSFMKTEPINEEWTRFITALNEAVTDFDPALIDFNDKDYSKLLCYIMYRNLPETYYDKGTMMYFSCVSACFVIICDWFSLKNKGCLTKGGRLDNVRRWSKQIEYSTDNIDIIISEF